MNDDFAGFDKDTVDSVREIALTGGEFWTTRSAFGLESELANRALACERYAHDGETIEFQYVDAGGHPWKPAEDKGYFVCDGCFPEYPEYLQLSVYQDLQSALDRHPPVAVLRMVA